MCGILVAVGDYSEELFKRDLEKIAHRGQNGSGIRHGNNSLFGFNRLAINDKSTMAMQPFEFGGLIGVFNGEIYNADTLRNTFNIKTNSKADTEVILPLFAMFGPSMIQYLDGFYAGVIQDQETGEFFLLRDHVGKKPLFYCKSGKQRFFTSELKAIETIDAFESIPRGLSIYEEDNIILAEKHQIQAKEIGNLNAEIVQAVHKRIPIGEERYGVFVSGGLDSSIIAQIVSQKSKNVTYYTLGNKESEDSYYVHLLAKALGIEKQLKFISLPDQELLPELIRKVIYATESWNPSIVSNGLATYLLSEKAKKDGIDVVLSGEGADELFCGYPVTSEASTWFAHRPELIKNMQFTELRRLDLASMANTIEVRCPFLDRSVYATALECKLEDLIELDNGKLQGKRVLRTLFSDTLPAEIAERKKVSFDVGSGIRKLVVEYLLTIAETERLALKEIWKSLFPGKDYNHPYFSHYPIFDDAISKRGVKHK